MEIFELNLPSPNIKIKQRLDYLVRTVEFEQSGKIWLNEFHQNKLNLADYKFASDPTLTKLVNDQYYSLFKIDFFVSYGIFNGQSSCHSPHIDRARMLALNYYYTLGGENVETVFYNKKTDKGLSQAQNYRYDELIATTRFKFEVNKWYAYEVSRAHSVENINGTRIFLAIMLGSKTITDEKLNTYALEDFDSNYKNFISKRISNFE
jgi:hypothetical protein